MPADILDGMSKASELADSMFLAATVQSVGVFTLIGAVVLRRLRHKGNTPVKSRFAPALSAAMAYGMYIAAALAADARFPEFLRNHLFDGLAPAAVVGLLIDRIPVDNTIVPFPRIRLPIVIVVLFYAAGFVVFGAIAAAAVFSAGSSHFTTPVIYSGTVGGTLFPAMYFVAATATGPRWMGYRGTVKWLFTRQAKVTGPAGEGDDSRANDLLPPAHADRPEPVTGPEVAG
jgi:hypothetical protein